MENENKVTETSTETTETSGTVTDTTNTDTTVQETGSSESTGNTESTTETNTNNDSTEDKTIPYNRFKEVNDKYKTLKEEMETISEKVNSYDKEKETLLNENSTKIEELKNTISNLNKEKEEMIIDSYKPEDKEYLNFLLGQERGKEENKEKSLNDLLDTIKGSKPNLFKVSSSVGNPPSSNNSDANTMSLSEYNTLPKDERMKVIRRGVKVV